jgi:hypothetical protein
MHKIWSFILREERQRWNEHLDFGRINNRRQQEHELYRASLSILFSEQYYGNEIKLV